MLIYHPIRDLSHCMFRIFCLSHDVENKKNPIDLMRILDFYILFPHVLASMSLPRELTKKKKVFKEVGVPYEYLPKSSRLMFELSMIQDQVFKTLMAKGILEKDEFSSGYIVIRETVLPVEIQQLIEKSAFRKTEWCQALVNSISKIPLKGNKGLKKRSGLLEYRYDNV